MRHGKWIWIAAIAFGGIGLSVQSLSAQYVPGGKNPEQTIPQKVQSPMEQHQEGGMGGMASMSTDDIKKAKEALKAKGLNPGPIDGTLDSKTQQALREFQQANKLPVTGTLDPQTAEKLGVISGGGRTSTEPRSRHVCPQRQVWHAVNRSDNYSARAAPITQNI